MILKWLERYGFYYSSWCEILKDISDDGWRNFIEKKTCFLCNDPYRGYNCPHSEFCRSVDEGISAYEKRQEQQLEQYYEDRLW
jgi:hypothetical protein